MRCAVVGAGAWGTALADLLARNGHGVALWAHEPDVADGINARHENARFLPGVSVDPSVMATNELGRVARAAELVVFVAPSHVLRGIARGAAPAVQRGATVAVATKGIERETLALMTDVVAAEVRGHSVVALSGPSFAAEVARRQPTAVVAASRNDAAALLTQRVLSSDWFRVYTHFDVTGVELGGALKNVMAVAAGICEGLGLGYNPRAALITRGLAEMTRLGVALGASAQTFAGLAGLGDLVLTCTGALSRNRALGMEIGRGSGLEQALAGRDTVAEGVVTAESAQALAGREGVEMPIVDAVCQILFGGRTPRDAMADLMARELRPELDP
jgi:glycerol-3-phosphate dehydrogenase (NAD(P)+)